MTLLLKPLIAVTKSDLAYVAECLGESWNEIVSLEKFTGKAGQDLCYPSFGQISAQRIIIVGAGDGDLEGHRQAARAAGMLARQKEIESLAYQTRTSNSLLNQHIIRSVAAGNYLYDRFKASEDQKATLQQFS